MATQQGKKTSQRKTAAKKSSQKKTSQKKTSRKESPRKQISSSRAGSSNRAQAPRAEPRRRRSGTEIAQSAAGQLAELAGKEVEALTGLERTDDGWQVEVEVLELRRVPNTTDVLASYLVTTDEDGELEGYHRVRRYVRGSAGGDDR